MDAGFPVGTGVAGDGERDQSKYKRIAPFRQPPVQFGAELLRHLGIESVFRIGIQQEAERTVLGKQDDL